MHLSSSHQMFSHGTTALFLAFWTYIDVRYLVNIIIFGKFSQSNLVLHHIAQQLIEVFLIKKCFFCFYWFWK